MEDKVLLELKEVIQSSQINFLIGSGASRPFLPVLNNIEVNLNKAKSVAEREVILKEYLTQVMIPNLSIIDKTALSDVNFIENMENYSSFFQCLSAVLLKRKSTLLSKQANIFTTNIDFMMESILENLQLEFNDGFSGKFNPAFGIENFKRSIFQRSLHFDHISEIPLFNIIKIHGSLTWKLNESKDKITLARNLEVIDKDLPTKTGSEFLDSYQNILVVNPEEAKHLQSVLIEYYSELLRLFSSELEKENALLFVLGFSMDDKHIKQITLRAAKSNPTLRIYICCSQPSRAKMEKKMEASMHPNVHFLIPESATDKFSLKVFTDLLLKNILKNEDPQP
jgi:hypothetical protein